jgi:6-pyruvoyl-tetrahydropterin synthase
MIVSLDAKQTVDQFQHSFMIKILESSGIESTKQNIIKAIYIKMIANIKLNREKSKEIPLK